MCCMWYVLCSLHLHILLSPPLVAAALSGTACKSTNRLRPLASTSSKNSSFGLSLRGDKTAIKFHDTSSHVRTKSTHIHRASRIVTPLHGTASASASACCAAQHITYLLHSPEYGTLK
ncbi:hypothetical protein B0J11DRAFT_535698 [Dendryphion nanum]|uniref:Secreted protein n=1 Tax=Dendryphion nanum TaxID=256645 RepID=A0A9P9DGQ9_9PLEO|nr:hypothetical protein B0J11DRAFT_535698 [Dendryphion nanum]